jgi:hypothetical protein
LKPFISPLVITPQSLTLYTIYDGGVFNNYVTAVAKPAMLIVFFIIITILYVSNAADQLKSSAAAA